MSRQSSKRAKREREQYERWQKNQHAHEKKFVPKRTVTMVKDGKRVELVANNGLRITCKSLSDLTIPVSVKK